MLHLLQQKLQKMLKLHICYVDILKNIENGLGVAQGIISFDLYHLFSSS